MHLRNLVRELFFGCCDLLRRRRRRHRLKVHEGEKNLKRSIESSTSIQLSEASWRSTEQLSFFSPPFLLQISRYRSVRSLASVNKRFRNTSERFSQLRSVSVGGVRGEVFFLPPVLELFPSSADLKILIKTPENTLRPAQSPPPITHVGQLKASSLHANERQRSWTSPRIEKVLFNESVSVHAALA